jgi:N-acetylglutamate synthase-like GNAT family acetyltransferase
MQVVELTHDKGSVCREILASLPGWFGIPESNAAYARDVETLPMFGVIENGSVAGFLALTQQSPQAWEIHVMGVRPQRHRSGVGRVLVGRAKRHSLEKGARFLTVKTLSSNDPDPGYAKTRAFYGAMGFVAIAELPELGGPENPTVLMLKVLA